MKKKGFTLIELIAVLVIMAILALIVTPLVMSIIKKAKVSADKRSIDAYGRSVELAIASYLLDNGHFPTSIDHIKVEYSGDEVVCSTTQLNSDSTVYLSGCTVGGRSVEGYTYGKEETIIYDAYQVGDHVSYNGVTYYVIEDSDATNDTVKLLKENPLTVAEVNHYGAGHVNMNVPSSETYYQKAYNDNGYGSMHYYSSETCGYNGSEWVNSGCTTNYAQSEVKYVVDAWKNSAVASGDTAIARLIMFEDLIDNLGYGESSKQCTGSCWYKKPTDTPSWVYNSNYGYWTMSQYYDTSFVWFMRGVGDLGEGNLLYNLGCVRPVLELNKSADITKLAS